MASNEMLHKHFLPYLIVGFMIIGEFGYCIPVLRLVEASYTVCTYKLLTNRARKEKNQKNHGSPDWRVANSATFNHRSNLELFSFKNVYH